MRTALLTALLIARLAARRSCDVPPVVVGEEASVPPRIDTSPPVATITTSTEDMMMLATTLKPVSLDPAVVPTFADYAELWFARGLANRWHYKSAKTYRCHLDRYLIPLLGPLAVDQITRRHAVLVEDALIAAGLADHSRHAILTLLGGILRQAVRKDEFMAVNPLADQRFAPIKRKRAVRVYDRTELAHFLATAMRLTPDLAPLLAVMGQAGLRVGEAMALSAEAVDCERQVLHITRACTPKTPRLVGLPKGGKIRDVDMPASLTAILRPLTVAHPDGYLLRNRDGGPVNYKTIRRVIARVAKVAELPALRPHELRHSWASSALVAGLPLEWVSRMLGHADTSITSRVYGRWLPHPRPAALDAL